MCMHQYCILMGKSILEKKKQTDTYRNNFFIFLRYQISPFTINF